MAYTNLPHDFAALDDVASSPLQENFEWIESQITNLNSGMTGWENKFDTTSGHDHDGTDSKKVAHSDLTGLTGGNPHIQYSLTNYGTFRQIDIKPTVNPPAGTGVLTIKKSAGTVTATHDVHGNVLLDGTITAPIAYACAPVFLSLQDRTADLDGQAVAQFQTPNQRCYFKDQIQGYIRSNTGDKYWLHLHATDFNDATHLVASFQWADGVTGLISKNPTISSLPPNCYVYVEVEESHAAAYDASLFFTITWPITI